MLATLERYFVQSPPWKVAIWILAVSLFVASTVFAEDIPPTADTLLLVDTITGAAWSIVGSIWALIFATTWKG